jgi:hypothetical protein
MALQMHYTAPFYTAFPEAYVRVVKVDLDYDARRASIEYWVYPMQTVRLIDKHAVIQRVMLPVFETPEAPIFSGYFGADVLSQAGMNPLAAAYAFLKTRSDFAGATDV